MKIAVTPGQARLVVRALRTFVNTGMKYGIDNGKVQDLADAREIIKHVVLHIKQGEELDSKVHAERLLLSKAVSAVGTALRHSEDLNDSDIVASLRQIYVDLQRKALIWDKEHGKPGEFF